MSDTNAAVIGAPNWLDATYYTVVLSGGHWLSSAGLDYLKDPLLSLAAISASAGAAAAVVDVDLGTIREVNLLAFPDTNISRDGRISLQTTQNPKWAGATVPAITSAGASTLRVQAGSSAVLISVGDVFSIAGVSGTHKSSTTASIAAGSSATIALAVPLASTAQATAITCHTGDFSAVVGSIEVSTPYEDVWPIIYADGVLSWEHPSFWDGKRTAEEAEDFPIPYIKVFGSTISARYWRIRIDDTANADGYVSLNRLFMTEGWFGEIFIEYGANLGFLTDSTTRRTRAGAKLHQEYDQRRIVSFTVPKVELDTALQQAFDIQKRMGTTRQVFIVLDKDDLINRHRLAWCGTLQQLPPQVFATFERNDVPFVIEEDIA